ncbi:MAG: hypothetical protein HPY78_05240 [Brevinematales bacterium]|nr:hypothetical protein [Brevinematales bacterium]
MQTKKWLGFVGVVMMIMVGCTTTPKEKEEVKNYPFLGTEWQLVSWEMANGMSLGLSPDDFFTFTFSESQMLIRVYDDRVLTSEYTTNLVEFTSTTFSMPDSEYDDESDINYIGVSKIWYTVSGDTMKYTNWVFTGTNENDPNDVTNMCFIGAGTPFISQTFKARQ